MSRGRSCRKDAEGEVEETGTEVEDWGKRWERWDPEKSREMGGRGVEEVRLRE